MTDRVDPYRSVARELLCVLASEPSLLLNSEAAWESASRASIASV